MLVFLCKKAPTSHSSIQSVQLSLPLHHVLPFDPFILFFKNLIHLPRTLIQNFDFLLQFLKFLMMKHLHVELALCCFKLLAFDGYVIRECLDQVLLAIF